jgi:polyisoprenoid-binding protein YceI
MRCLGPICLVALSVTPVLRAEELTVDFDRAKTEVTFVLTDVLHTVHGAFQLKEGHISFDPATDAITGDIVVDAASGNSGNVIRDRRMTRKILEADRYPDVRFTPFKLAGTILATGVSTVEIAGSFLIHGQTHEITIPMRIQMSQTKITATGKFIVPYVEWGMKDPSSFLLKVNDRVEIGLTAVGHISGRRTP